MRTFVLGAWLLVGCSGQNNGFDLVEARASTEAGGASDAAPSSPGEASAPDSAPEAAPAPKDAQAPPQEASTHDAAPPQDAGAPVEEASTCGECSLPEVCGGNGPTNVCGEECLSQFASECVALCEQSDSCPPWPINWGVTECNAAPYVIQSMQPVFREGGLAGCVQVAEYTCCP